MVAGIMLPVQHGRAPAKRRGRSMPTKKGYVWAMLKHRLRKTKHKHLDCSAGIVRKRLVKSLEFRYSLGIAMINQQESTL